MVLVSRNSNCSFTSQISQAQELGSVGVIVYNTEHDAMVDMYCYTSSDCAQQLTTEATMISYDDGMTLLKLLRSDARSGQFTSSKSVSVAVGSSYAYNSIGFGFGIDSNSSASSLGYFLYPSFQFYGWAAQWLQYTKTLEAEVRVDEREYTVEVQNIWNHSKLDNSGLSTVIQLPPISKLQQSSAIQVELYLSCDEDNDANCPAWDQFLDVTCFSTSLPILYSLIVLTYMISSSV